VLYRAVVRGLGLGAEKTGRKLALPPVIVQALAALVLARAVLVGAVTVLLVLLADAFHRVYEYLPDNIIAGLFYPIRRWKMKEGAPWRPLFILHIKTLFRTCSIRRT